MPLLGTMIKPFKACSYKSGKFVTVTDAEISGRWAVFFFYPADFTYVCPTELEDLADNFDEFCRLGIDIFSVSTDTVYSHKVWHDISPAIAKVQFHMLADQGHIISSNFDVLRPGEGIADRGTFVVDPDGIIRIIEITSDGVGRSASELLRKIQAAQYVAANPGEVCPAKWEDGDETITPAPELVGRI
ncbi:alkyl hydroperoxide reductase subunit C [Sphingomonas sp. PR090111-T3T-6A]|uniref:alkyl hydroperoxide reductase subunit C n=1 Tax=Sphingomonas sp. PR090111-T3T-6A TaxID=685778 RepID=UPI00037FF307|nr:alkyl hydroperoxide reductase subunit C [Sphingomonas sp. PR090111-T3T-6A]